MTSYEQPTVRDLGTLVELTLGSGLGLSEDGSEKHVVAVVPGLIGTSLSVLP